jgi:hypothetical protein
MAGVEGVRAPVGRAVSSSIGVPHSQFPSKPHTSTPRNDSVKKVKCIVFLAESPRRLPRHFADRKCSKYPAHDERTGQVPLSKDLKTSGTER